MADQFKFYSTLVGDFRLAVKDIRVVECVSRNSVKLSTVTGDALTVSFVDSGFAVRTSFGKVDLAADSVRKFSVSAGGTGAYPPGLVALWAGDDNGRDLVGNHQAILKSTGFSSDDRGQSFSFNGVNSYLQVPASASLDLGFENNLTITAWIRPGSVFGETPILEFERVLGTQSGTDVGLQFFFSVNPPSGNGVGSLMCNLLDSTGNSHLLASAAGLVTAGT